mmetsp:Transcript_30967/g.100885  ORF Transcript_30967/g.100885 Transcript_30967/m.100885 type:complete len:253 (+) Transcript_30967:396-1154(+)
MPTVELERNCTAPSAWCRRMTVNRRTKGSRADITARASPITTYAIPTTSQWLWIGRAPDDAAYHHRCCFRSPAPTTAGTSSVGVVGTAVEGSSSASSGSGEGVAGLLRTGGGTGGVEVVARSASADVRPSGVPNAPSSTTNEWSFGAAVAAASAAPMSVVVVVVVPGVSVGGEVPSPRDAGLAKARSACCCRWSCSSSVRARASATSRARYCASAAWTASSFSMRSDSHWMSSSSLHASSSAHRDSKWSRLT